MTFLSPLKIELKNCYGIKQFNHTFSFKSGRAHLIYAPNGSMKTSFAKTLRFFSKQEKTAPKDSIFTDRETTYSITIGGENVSSEQLFVFNGEDDIDSSESFVNFLASAELKRRYDEIYALLTKEKDDLITKLKSISQSSDCEKEIVESFANDENETIFSIFERIYPLCNNSNICYLFKYNDIFDKKGNVKKFIDNFKSEIQNYFDVYFELLRSSDLFRSEGDFNFGTYHVSQLRNLVSDGSFFGVKHRIILHNGTEIKSITEFEQCVNSEQERILSNTELKKAFKKITDAIDKNIELREFKKVLENHPEWIPDILNFDQFKQKVWLGFLSDSEIFPLFKNYFNVFSSHKEELYRILKDAEAQQDVWSNIINLYNARFHVPVKLSITNQRDVILKQQAAKLAFYYIDGNQQVAQTKAQLSTVLSRGEKRAFYILQFLLEMEKRKRSNTKQIIVLDDISDSFDYQNKFAIIEYIKDLIQHPGSVFHFIILTHNYDFYRTLSSRLPIHYNNMWMTERSLIGEIKLLKGQYKNDVFSNAFIGNEQDDAIFISMIPFVRNLVEYTKGAKSEEYKTLTSCLHIKDNTSVLTENDVLTIIKQYLQGNDSQRIPSDTKIFDTILSTAKRIADNPNLDAILIQNKIVLSIAIRLLAEDFMLSIFISDGIDKAKYKMDGSQFGKWFDLFKNTHPNHPKRTILERVSMMTPEFIHINSFMFEPLIDMSIDQLLDLYRDCADLK